MDLTYFANVCFIHCSVEPPIQFVVFLDLMQLFSKIHIVSSIPIQQRDITKYTGTGFNLNARFNEGWWTNECDPAKYIQSSHFAGMIISSTYSPMINTPNTTFIDLFLSQRKPAYIMWTFSWWNKTFVNVRTTEMTMHYISSEIVPPSKTRVRFSPISTRSHFLPVCSQTRICKIDPVGRKCTN